jgi:hypothetical protein
MGGRRSCRLRSSRVHDPQKMVREHQDFRSFVRVVHSDLSMRLSILVGTHRSREKVAELLAPLGRERGSGSGAMLIACRLAGLSARKAYYADVRARTQFGPPAIPTRVLTVA